MKKILLILMIFRLSHTSEFRKLNDAEVRRKDIQYEEEFLNNKDLFENKYFVYMVTSVGNVFIQVDENKNINKIIYSNKNKEIKREEYYDNADIYKLNIASYLEGDNLNEKSNVKSGIERVIEYYDYDKNNIKKILIFYGLKKTFEIEFNEKGKITKIFKN